MCIRDRLPGIGSYTAGAIASIAFGIPAPAVDGNVLRVVARITGSREDIGKQSVKTGVERLVAGVIPRERCGDFNQALIELGALDVYKRQVLRVFPLSRAPSDVRCPGPLTPFA